MALEQPPVTGAGYDQARAGADDDIDLLIQAHRTTAAEAGDQQATVTVGHLIADRGSPELAGLLAAAVRRLAGQGTRPGDGNGTAGGLRALAAANLRAAAQATAAIGSADSAAGVRLQNTALQARAAARAAAWAAGLLDGTDLGSGSVTVRLLAGAVTIRPGGKAAITVTGEPRPLAWRAGEIARQAAVPVSQLSGTEVTFIAEDWGNDQVVLYGFQPAS